MRNKETLERLREKVKQLWQIAAQDAQDEHALAVAHVYHDIQGLFKELNQRPDYASQDCQATASDGILRPRQESPRLVPRPENRP